VGGQDDGLLKVGPLLERFRDWRGFLGRGVSGEDAGLVRGHERTGRPSGSARFVAPSGETTESRPQTAQPGPEAEGERSVQLPYERQADICMMSPA